MSIELQIYSYFILINFASILTNKKYAKNAATEMQERAEKEMGKDVDLNMERNQEMTLDEGELQDLRKKITYLQSSQRKWN